MRKELKELIVAGTELKRIRESANLSRSELASRLGEGYKAGNVGTCENEGRYVGLTMLKRWAEACGHTFQIVFEPGPDVPLKPETQITRPGWFVREETNTRHYDSGTGISVCGRFSSGDANRSDREHNHPDNCGRCCQLRKHISIYVSTRSSLSQQPA